MSRVFLTLIRREFWENKSLWIAPLVVVAIMIGGAVFAPIGGQNSDGFSISPPTVEQAGRAMSAISLTGIVMFLGTVAAFAVFAYLLDCLYAERRDRSILFWKSLPVSDTQTVLAKLVVATLVVPAGAVLLALLTQPLVALITWLRFEPLRPYIDFSLFAAWPYTLSRIGLLWAFALLWYAPLVAYLMLASVVAKRSPWTYATLPLVVLVLAERLTDSSYIRTFLLERLFPWPTRLMHLRGSGPAFEFGPRTPAGVETHWWIPFQDPKLWIGLAVAAGMLYIVIRLRRYRDDT